MIRFDKVGFVIPWYGRSAHGGAETHCRRLAESLRIHGVNAEIITTTVSGLTADWGTNAYRPGLYYVNGVPVRRFLVRPIDGAAFNRANERLMRNEPVDKPAELDYLKNSCNSDGLYTFLDRNREEYIYIFIPYLFGTSLNGTAVAPERSFVIPCLHDEGYARLRFSKRMFYRVRGALFQTDAELELAKRLYPSLDPARCHKVGCGVDHILESDPAGFREKYSIADPFILYAGRRDETKNVHTLYSHFAEFKKRNPGNLRLVSIGVGKMPIPAGAEKDIIDLGFVPVKDKWSAYGAMTALSQPSKNEAFSIVVIESMYMGKPVLVNADCGPTAEHVRKSGCGRVFGDYGSFERGLGEILALGSDAGKIGRAGKTYAESNFTWDRVARNYLDLFGRLTAA